MALLIAGCGKHGVDFMPASGGGYSPPPPAAGGHHKVGKPYKVMGQWYSPLQSAAGYDQRGVASWYGRDFHGKKTANGETYDMHAMSAAHKTLPLPTMVRVTNLDNGRTIVVRVNDRGPFVKSRIIDLSYAGARALGYDRRGTAHVRVEALDGRSQASIAPPSHAVSATPSPRPTSVVPTPPSASATLPADAVFVQVGAFSSYANAQRMKARLTDFSAVVIQHTQVIDRQIYRVRIGPLTRMPEVERTVLALQRAGFGNAIVVIE
ncbi:MAG: septal ring lytic transglycosylase RlpA family protein [Mariprofundales bacterium]